MADMRTELNRAITRAPDSAAARLWGAYTTYLENLIRRAQAKAWEEGRTAAGRGIRNNPYLEERTP